MANLKWYIVNTLSGCEKKAHDLLLDRISKANEKDPSIGEMFGEVLIPTETVVDTTKGGKARTSSHKFFPGYMLVQMDMNETTWHIVNDTPKISGFVGNRKNPPAMSDAEVDRIKGKMNTNVEKTSHGEDLELKCTVKLLDGPFKTFTGSVEAIDREKESVSVNVSILGRVVPVELKFSQVERVTDNA